MRSWRVTHGPSAATPLKPMLAVPRLRVGDAGPAIEKAGSADSLHKMREGAVEWTVTLVALSMACCSVRCREDRDPFALQG